MRHIWKNRLMKFQKWLIILNLELKFTSLLRSFLMNEMGTVP
jgi:hypothetical protein